MVLFPSSEHVIDTLPLPINADAASSSFLSPFGSNHWLRELLRRFDIPALARTLVLLPSSNSGIVKLPFSICAIDASSIIKLPLPIGAVATSRSFLFLSAGREVALIR
jgi:hypothetical protein